MANTPMFCLVLALVLTLISAFVYRTAPAPYPGWLPHFGWLGVAAFLLSMLVK